MSLEKIIQNEKTTVVDVRTPGEYMGSHVANSINIPLDEVPKRIEEFKSMEGPVVLCCASGGRSEQATRYLQQNGLEEVYNGGSWFEVNAFA